MKNAVKWTSTVNQVENRILVDVDQEKCSMVDVDQQENAVWSMSTDNYFSIQNVKFFIIQLVMESAVDVHCCTFLGQH